MWEKQTNGLFGQQCRQLFRARSEIQAKSVGIVARPRKLDRPAHKAAFEWVSEWPAQIERASARFLALQAVNFQPRRHVWERRPSAPRNRRIWFPRAAPRGLVSQISSLFAENIEKERGDSAKSRARSRCGNAAWELVEGVRAVQSGPAVVTSAARSRESARRCVRALSRKTQPDSLTLGVMLRADD
jgi:hypothetical protein